MPNNPDDEEIQKIQESNTTTRSISPEDSRYPYSIVWTPIPLITWICPCIGHVGIGDSKGVLHDFAGSYYVSVDDFAFGDPYKYVPLQISDTKSQEYDTAIHQADTKFNQEIHALCCNNCHTYVADALNRIQFEGRKSHTMIDICCKVTCASKYVHKKYKALAYMPFIILASIVMLMYLILKYASQDS